MEQVYNEEVDSLHHRVERILGTFWVLDDFPAKAPADGRPKPRIDHYRTTLASLLRPDALPKIEEFLKAHAKPGSRPGGAIEFCDVTKEQLLGKLASVGYMADPRNTAAAITQAEEATARKRGQGQPAPADANDPARLRRELSKMGGKPMDIPASGKIPRTKK